MMANSYTKDLPKEFPLSTGFFINCYLADVKSTGWTWKNLQSCEYSETGESRKGRSMAGFRVGHGPLNVSVIAGAHSDEPVGPRTALMLAEGLALKKSPFFKELAERATWWIIPHINPDGEAVNTSWMKTDSDFHDYARYVCRELPGEDVEFCYPDMRFEKENVVSDSDCNKWLEQYSKPPRPENQFASRFFTTSQKPFDLHLSLHSMAVANGAWYLVCREWADRWMNSEVADWLVQKSAQENLGLHDWDRKGEKGFSGIAPGYSTTPRHDAMRDFFLEKQDPEMAARFRPSSMEMIQSLGDDPLCLVSELPGYVIGNAKPGQASEDLDQFLEFAKRWRETKSFDSEKKRKMAVSRLLTDIPLRKVSFETQSRLQLAFILAGLNLVSGV